MTDARTARSESTEVVCLTCPGAHVVVCDPSGASVFAATDGAADALGVVNRPGGPAVADWFTGPARTALDAALSSARRGDPWPATFGRGRRARELRTIPTRTGLVVEIAPIGRAVDTKGALAAIDRVTRSIRVAPTAEDAARLTSDALRGLTGFSDARILGDDGRALWSTSNDSRGAPDPVLRLLTDGRAGLAHVCPTGEPSAVADTATRPARLIAAGPDGHLAARAIAEAGMAADDNGFGSALRALGVTAWLAIPFRGAQAAIGGVLLTHTEPERPGFTTVTTARLVVDALQWRLDELSRTDRVDRERRALAFARVLVDDANERTLAEALARNIDDALRLARCDALALVTPVRVNIYGDGPSRALVRGLALYGADRNPGGPWFTDALPRDDRLPALDRRATGLAVLPMGHDGRTALLAMRHDSAISATGERQARPWSAADRSALAAMVEACTSAMIRSSGANEHTANVAASRRRELERFTDVIAHELHQPLYELEMLASLIGRDDLAHRVDDTRELAAATRNAASRLRHVTVQLAHYSRIAGRTMSRRPCDLSELATEAFEATRASLADDATLEILPLPAVEGDRSQLRQLFIQLFSNAGQFASADRPLRVRVTGRRLDRGGVIVDVEDNGIGVPPRDLKRVFLPFVQATDEAAPGPGLGLAIVERIVDRHHGEVRATRAVPHGTCVRFSIDGGLP